MTTDNPKHYHGKPCINCGHTKRYVKQQACVKCVLDKRNHYARNNREREKERSRQYYAQNTEKCRTMSENWRLNRMYGLTVEGRDELAARQEGKCAICAEVPEKLHIDHCHTHGHVRGLLCGNCNRALGLLKENTKSLEAAIAYLNSTQAANDAN